MHRKSNKEICIDYLNKYEDKDLEGITGMFDENIVLRDWKIKVEGIERALLETRKNFDAVDSIAIEVLSTYESADAVAAELKITLNQDEELYVIDVITLNKDAKISAIKAYLGRGD